MRYSITARTLGFVALAAAAACTRRPVEVGSPAPEPAAPARRAIAVDDATSLIRAMHQRYESSWYKTLTFVQKTAITLPSGTAINQTWYEAMSLPGRLRIDIGEPSQGNGQLFRNDSVYQFANGVVTRVTRDVNPLLVLGFDVYGQSPERTIAVLRARGIDFAKFHDRSWQGKPVWVVGANAGDTTSRQFWVEKERLLFVRLLEPSQQGRSDIRFNNYVRAGGGWVAIEVLQYVNGRLRLREDYSSVRADVALDDRLFVPSAWKTAPHWRR